MERCSRNKSFLNSRARPSALATAVATPILMSSVIRSNCKSTWLFFHGFGHYSKLCGIADTLWSQGLRLCLGKSAWRERRNVQWRGLAGDQISHDARGQRCEQDAIAEVPSGDENSRCVGLADERQIVRGPGAQTNPAFFDGKISQFRDQPRRSAVEVFDHRRLDGPIVASVFYCCTDDNSSRAARNQIDVRRKHTMLQQILATRK